MNTPFVAPQIQTRHLIGAVDLIASFRMTLELSERQTERTIHGERIHQRIIGGRVAGPRLTGAVYPNGGGEYGLIRADAVMEMFSRFMLIAANGEWLYGQLIGYCRPDGYARFQATFDADAQGPHAWLNETMFIGAVEASDSAQHRMMTFFEAA